MGPVFNVLRGIADHNRFSSRAARRMEAHDLIARHRKQTEGVVVAQRSLGHKRELGQVRKRLQVIGVHTRFIKGFFVKRHVVIGMA